MTARDEAIQIFAELLHMQPANGTLGRLVDCLTQATTERIKAERPPTLGLPSKKAIIDALASVPPKKVQL